MSTVLASLVEIIQQFKSISLKLNKDEGAGVGSGWRCLFISQELEFKVANRKIAKGNM